MLYKVVNIANFVYYGKTLVSILYELDSNRKHCHRTRFRSIPVVQYQKVAMVHAIVIVIVQLVDVNRILESNHSTIAIARTKHF